MALLSLYKIDSAKFFLSGMGKQRSTDAAKSWSTYKQEQEIKKIIQQHKLVPSPRIVTANKIKGVFNY